MNLRKEENKNIPIQFNNELHSLEFVEGVLVQSYHPNLKHMSLAIAKKMIEERNLFSKEKKCPVLVLTQNGRSIDNDARMYFGSAEANVFVCAGALVVNHAIAKLICTFVLKFSNFPFPTKIFLSEGNALKWIKQFRHLN